MNKQSYMEFRGRLINTVNAFIKGNGYEAKYEEGMSEDENGHFRISLPHPYGNLTISAESWVNASYNGQVNVLSIPMRFETYRDEGGKFKRFQGGVNPFNGKFCLNRFPQESAKLESAFNEFLGMLK